MDVSGAVTIVGHTDLQDVSLNTLFVNENLDVSGNVDVVWSSNNSRTYRFTRCVFEYVVCK